MTSEFRVVCGTGMSTSYKPFDTEKEARAWAAKAIGDGYVSQIAVEERRDAEWVLVELRVQNRQNST